MSDSFYRAFEEHHRGSRELIKSRLRAYTPFINPLASRHRPVNAIDLGCGRGEWLELLSESGIDAYGVDLDQGMLDACRERGLHAYNADALATLRAAPDGSAALVSAFHVVEHITFDDLQTLVREALRVLKPGGLLILETPNPENLVVGASDFYKDPSHARPIPWELLRFVVEHAGFRRNVVMRLQESPELHATSAIRLIHVLSGVSPDYAVVAQKGGNTETFPEFDEPFRIGYGISLDSLAQRYDVASENRIAEIKNILTAAEARAVQHAQQADNRIAQMEDRLAQMEALMHGILFSRSWRAMAPLRVAARLRAAIREGRLVSGGKTRIKLLLQGAGMAMMRHAAFRQAALAVLGRMPRLKLRLRAIIMPDSTVTFDSAVMRAQKPEHLAPRAKLIYTELKKIIDGKKS